MRDTLFVVEILFIKLVEQHFADIPLQFNVTTIKCSDDYLPETCTDETMFYIVLVHRTYIVVKKRPMSNNGGFKAFPRGRLQLSQFTIDPHIQLHPCAEIA